MAELFTQEERRAIMATALDAVKGESEEARRRGDVGTTSTKTERQKVREKIAADVVRTVRNNITNTVLSLLPREVAATIRFQAFAKNLSETLGVPPIASSIIAKIAAGAGPILVQVQRSIQQQEQRRLALISARGPFVSPENVIKKFSFGEQVQESKEKLADLFLALATGRGETAKDISTFLIDKGRASVAAARAYNEALAEGGLNNFTFAKTAAEEEFNKQVGRIPIKLYRAYSVLHERANIEFEKFAKDPPLKG